MVDCDVLLTTFRLMMASELELPKATSSYQASACDGLNKIIRVNSEESGLIVTHLLYKAALVLAVLRWILAWALRFKNRTHLASPSSDSPQQSQPVPSPQQIRYGLILTSFSDVTERMPGVCDTCAVCLSQLRDEDEGPSADTISQNLARTRSEPSWAVERILYLFGDDLMM
ncbi:RING/U-BOX SUPERFAMILY PROTEIN [Salix viminalis]|uniref:RING/U-BOX SUPERFAMILY PROTEIN n=1 Tax=Salix viminalis TaxID=40686 RepID=A0A9Q0V714_SALVM|nr:RING/U-BOX SUPERFAMILY PROTEIN [Salix viminalis]